MTGLQHNGRPLRINGFATVFDSEIHIDGQTEKFVFGAFAPTLSRGGIDVRMTVNHRRGETWASVREGSLSLWEDECGLAFSAQVPATSHGHGLARAVADGQIEASVLFRGFGKKPAPGGTIVTAAILTDICLTTAAAYPTAVWLSDFALMRHMDDYGLNLMRRWRLGYAKNRTRTTAAAKFAYMKRRIALAPLSINARAPGRPAAGKSFRMQARGSVGEIFIFDDIGDSFDGTTAKSFAADLKALGAVRTLNIFINSPGGAVFDGVAIYNQLKRHRARKVVFIDGIAASVASVIAMAGDEINIAANGFMMVHKPWAVTGGTDSDHHKTANQLSKIGDSILNIYTARTGTAANVIADMMAAETWMNAEEALRHGFADKITEEVAIAAKFDLSKLTNPPAELLAAMRRAA